MAHRPDENSTPSPTPSGDPRLHIPEVLRTPVKKPELLREMNERDSRVPTQQSVEAAKGWAIAMNFVYGVIAGGLLGWAVQSWITPSWAPWPLIVGLAAGLVGGFIRFIREGLKAMR